MGWFYLKPEWNRFRELRSETRGLEKVAAELDFLINKKNQLLEVMNSIPRADLDKVAQAVPQGPHAKEVLVLLDVLAKERGISLTTIDLQSTAEEEKGATGRSPLRQYAIRQPTPGPPVMEEAPAGEFKELLVTFNIGASYSAFKNFLSDLERSLRLMDVQQISFQASEAGIFQYDMKVKAYYQ